MHLINNKKYKKIQPSLPSVVSDDGSDKPSVSTLFKQLAPLIRCESTDIRDTIVNGLGYTNPAVFK